jgi:hypothetical protein
MNEVSGTTHALNLCQSGRVRDDLCEYSRSKYSPGSETRYETSHEPSLRSVKLISALLGPSTEMASWPLPASLVHTLNSLSSPCSPRSNPAPPALTRWAPWSRYGPTVNWNGEP